MHGGNNQSDFQNSQQIPLAVPPLNSVPYIGPGPVNSAPYIGPPRPVNSAPYIGPPRSVNSAPDIGSPRPVVDGSSLPTEADAKPVEKVGPSMVYLDSNTTRKEWDNILVSAKSAVALTGSAAMGMVGPIIGLMDIGESDDAYLFRVSLPGVANNKKEFSCDIEPDGKIHIRGVTTTGEQIVCKNSQIFRMQTQNLCPPGHFSITFHLPGPVDHKQFRGHFGNDGMLEGIVKKII
ncbi:alpha-crystallin domain-containing protein 22.3 [Ricinus communis]|uniref:SHSP domain-containing protein n=1 Tax=Ricinus communis TaxID=3988 RepID=B9RF38_RICCO|nr:alpha-crystallin domain-containing protein 22.3 [Ricinus communis]EEF49809.1 conserved hypothetical protein [Ricinus communis]|eukprot:XP_002512357.1 alpha-crystallin domain-containing protein 22.3 [Ricinus communis]